MLRNGMMRWWLCLTLLVAVAGFLYWMGWGGSRAWQSVTGWSQLPDRFRSTAEGNFRAFQEQGEAPGLRWWGHASMEVVWAGKRLVIDPVISDRIKLAPRLFDNLRMEDDRRFDLILLSHAHMDHLDNATLERLPPSRILLPDGTEDFLSDAARQRHQIQPMRLGEVCKLGELEVVPVPARHGGWRYPWQRGYFACGYIVRHRDEALYLAGDTAVGEHFEQIARDYAPKYAVLPIGAYAPQWFLQSRHLNPEEAWQAAERLGVEYVIPYHFGTYRLSMEPMDEPLFYFAGASLGRRAKWFLPLAGSDRRN